MKVTIVKMENGAFAIKGTIPGFFKDKEVFLSNFRDQLGSILQVDGVLNPTEWDCRTAVWESRKGATRSILNFKTGSEAEQGYKYFKEQCQKEEAEYHKYLMSQREAEYP